MNSVKANEQDEIGYHHTNMKPFTFGILFFFFAVTLFGLETLSWGTKATAIMVFTLSVLFLLWVLSRALLPQRVLSRLDSSFERINKSVLYSFLTLLWFLTFAAYLLGHIIAMGDGLAKIERDLLGVSLEVVGIIWFFLLFMILLSSVMPHGNQKPLSYMVFLGGIVTILSVGLIIYGAIWTCQASTFKEQLAGLFHIVAGIAIIIAALKRDTLSQLLSSA